jgi:hypothetical protein
MIAIEYALYGMMLASIAAIIALAIIARKRV